MGLETLDSRLKHSNGVLGRQYWCRWARAPADPSSLADPSSPVAAALHPTPHAARVCRAGGDGGFQGEQFTDTGYGTHSGAGNVPSGAERTRGTGFDAHGQVATAFGHWPIKYDPVTGTASVDGADASMSPFPADVVDPVTERPDLSTPATGGTVQAAQGSALTEQDSSTPPEAAR
jgi:hypothetical protein